MRGGEELKTPVLRVEGGICRLQAAEWDKPPGFTVLCWAALAGIDSDQELMDLGFPVKFWVFGSELGQVLAGGTRLLRWREEDLMLGFWGCLEVLVPLGILAPHNSGVLLSHKFIFFFHWLSLGLS